MISVEKKHKSSDMMIIIVDCFFKEFVDRFQLNLLRVHFPHVSGLVSCRDSLRVVTN